MDITYRRAIWQWGGSLLLTVVAFFVLRWCFQFIRNDESPRLLAALVALAVGVLGIWLVYWLSNQWISSIPFTSLREALTPLVFIAPAFLLLGTYLLYPALNTIYISFFDARSKNFVGLANYRFVFTDSDVHIAFRNNAMWMVIVTSVAVSAGLLIAVLVNRIRLESIAKSFIFLPMAISAVGASVIWRFVYAWQPPGRPQIGLLNAVVTALGGDPVAWYLYPPWNNLALMAIMIWMVTGFCMTIFSAAVKNVPDELVEAARIDGAKEFQVFFYVTIPYIRGVIITVSTTVLIMVLKVFDIVYVMTRGHYDTQVIANRMYLEMYRFAHFGRGSALAVLLFLAIVPAMIVNLRNLRRVETER